MIATRRPLDIPREGEISEASAAEHCWQMALSFANATGQQSLLKRYDRNVGWWVEPYVRIFRDIPPPDYRTGLDVWSMLSMLSGQYDRAVWETMPSDSEWVSVMTNQAPKNMLAAVAVVEPAQLTFARWFMGRAPFGTDDCRYDDLTKNPTGHDFLPHLLHAVHALIRVAPRRFGHINHEGLPKKVFGDNL